MESKPPHQKPARRKVHVLYYLNRGGQLDHPHLIEGYLHSTQDGLRLKDVKRWLAVLRGRGMPSSYAWSYKRTYKNGYVWHDLSDNDYVQPMCKNEYVLMGSEIRDCVPDKCKCGADRSAERRKELDELHKRLDNVVDYDHPRTVLKRESSARPGPLLPPPREEEERLAMGKPAKILTQTRSTDCELDAETSDDLSCGRPADQLGKNESNVYKARALAMASDKGADAATQTGESKRCSTEESVAMQADAPAAPQAEKALRCNATIRHVYKDANPLFSPGLAPSSIQEAASESPASTRSIKSTSSNRPSRRDPNPGARSSKHHASSQVLKQLLSCGSVDIDESSIFNLKSFALHPGAVVAHHSQRLNCDVSSSSWSCRPCGASGIPDNKSVSALSEVSKEAFGSSPDSAFLKKVMISSLAFGSTSPGYLSICSSSSPRRSATVEAREELQEDHHGGMKGMRLLRRGGSPRRGGGGGGGGGGAKWRELLWSPRREVKSRRKEKKLSL